MASAEPPRQPLDAADVSVVVPVGGAAPGWDRSALSLANLDPPPGEIVLVFDGPNEELEARSAGLAARVLVLDRPGGPARARNRGAATARGQLLLFIDSDVEVPNDLAARVAALFPTTGEPTAVMGSYDDSPAEQGLVSRYRNLLHHYVHQTGREQASTFWAGCGAVRRREFLALGGFDESYARPSIEDIELGSRLRRAGHTIHLVKQLQVKHLKRWRLGDMLSTDLFRRAVPWTRLMLVQGGLVNDLNVKSRDRLSVLLAFVPLIALATAWRWPVLLAGGGTALLALAMLNVELLRFFRRRHGLGFALAALPLYWIYLLVCGLGFGLGLIGHLAGSPDR
jgi:glycosyltransferase involved in cell wall biosynthesis